MKTASGKNGFKISRSPLEHFLLNNILEQGKVSE